MYKLNNARHNLLVLLIAVGLLASVAGQVQKCAAVGEYCQNHWDCCSNSCMSYLYKCVRNYYIYPYTFLTHEPPRKTIDQILELNFGTNNYVKPNAAPQPIGVYDRFLSANEIVQNNQQNFGQSSGSQDSFSGPVVASAVATVVKPTQAPVIQTASRLGAADEIVQITTEPNGSSSLSTIESSQTAAKAPAVVAPASTISPSTTNMPPVKCSEIGVKCYRNEECCSERCHGFLHQCVT